MSRSDQDGMLPIFEAAGDGRCFRATERAAGPWSAAFCHGGAPSALLVQVAEGVAPPVPMDVARVTVELLRPVPVSELEVQCSVVRDGRKLQLMAVSMRASATEVARASILRIRTEASPPVELAQGQAMSLPAAGQGEHTRSPQKGGFSATFDMRSVHGGFEQLGAASVWFRMRAPLVSGLETTPAARAVAAADYANGIAGILPFDDWSYPDPRPDRWPHPAPVRRLDDGRRMHLHRGYGARDLPRPPRRRAGLDRPRAADLDP